MDVLDAVRRVQAAAEADATGDPVAHIKLLEEIHRLRLVAETPAEQTMRMRFQSVQNICIRIAIEYNILQTIAANRGQSITASQLAQKTGRDELLIIRIMRVITHAGICEEVDYATYTSNDTTTYIVQDGAIGGEKHHTDLTFGVGGKLVEMMRQHGLYQFPNRPSQKSPLEYAFGKPIFQFFEQDREQKEAFDAYMAMRRDASSPQWFDVFPASEQLSTGDLKQGDEATLIVDVGGGKGHEIHKFHQKFPHLSGKFIVQDLQSTVDAARPAPEPLELMVHDFFDPQPVKGARMYYLRNIMHNWPDDKCQAILSKLVDAMDPEYSRILIDDYVLPNTGADGRAAAMDVLMMMFVSGIERTQHQWEDLLHASGLEIVHIWPAKTGLESVIEARVRR